MISDDASGAVQLGFTIAGYPGTGRRTEDEVDLASCERIDLLQGAFMGDLTMRLGDVDFSTRFGWVTLLGWLLTLGKLASAVQADEPYIAGFAESDDFISVRRHERFLFVASSYRPGIARVITDQFLVSSSQFISERLAWVTATYPATEHNPVMREVVSRLKRNVGSHPYGPRPPK